MKWRCYIITIGCLISVLSITTLDHTEGTSPQQYTYVKNHPVDLLNGYLGSSTHIEMLGETTEPLLSINR